jgi:hypothetical protein
VQLGVGLASRRPDAAPSSRVTHGRSLAITVYGVDAAWSKPSPSALRAWGGSFISLYLGNDNTGKNATKAQVNAYIAGGVEVVLNFEYNEYACRNGYAGGVADARLGLAQATALGLPVDDEHPIYFSPDDYDIGPSDRAALVAYLHGCSDVLGGKMRVGHYGGYNGTLWAYQSGFCGWLWQTYGWSYDANTGATRWLNVNIRQIQNGITVGGVSCDKDQAMTASIGAHGEDDMFSDADRKLLNTVAAEVDKALNLKDGGWPLPNLLRRLDAAASKPATAAVDAKAVAVELAAQIKSDPTFAQLLAQALAGDPTTAAAFKDTLTNSLKSVSVTATTSLGA